MRVRGQSDEPSAAADAAFSARFEVRDVDELLGFLARRTGDAQLAADLTAETFAAALIAGPSHRPGERGAGAALSRIALEQLADARRRGSVARGARRRLGMQHIELTAADRARIDALGEGRAPTLWLGHRPPEPSDFAIRLSMQLGAATLPARPAGRRRAAAAVLAGVVLLTVLAAVVRSVTGSGTTRVSGPRVIATLAPADGFGRTAAVAFGSVWLSATNDSAVLRVDPATRRVTARIPLDMDVNLGAGAGAIWAVPRRPSLRQTRLIRIDPRTNRVVARIPVPSPGGRYPLFGAAVLAGPRVWVVGAMGLLAVDPARNRPAREIVLGGDFLVVDSLLRGNELWVTRADLSITRFDALSGQRLGRLGWTAPSGFAVPHGNRMVTGAGGSVSLVDPVGGRTLWRTQLGTQLNDAVLVGGRLLVEGVNGASARDTLWELDPRTGHVRGALTVPGFSVNAMLRVDGDAWLVTADGHVIVVAP